MPRTNTPKSFKLDDWFADASLPEESADIYTRADVISEIRKIERELEEAGEVENAEPSLADKAAVNKLEKRWAELAEQFADSKVTVTVQALTGEQRRVIREAHEKANESNTEFVFRILSNAIIGLQRAGGEYQEVSMAQSDLRKLYEKIGDAQITHIHNAYLQATEGLPEVDADFLSKSSSPDGGPE